MITIQARGTGLGLVVGSLSSARVLGMLVLPAECVEIEKEGGQVYIPMHIDCTAVSMKVPSGR